MPPVYRHVTTAFMLRLISLMQKFAQTKSSSRAHIKSTNLNSFSSLPMKLYCDNKATISISHNLVLHDRRKYLEVDKHIIKKKEKKKIMDRFVWPMFQLLNRLANIRTKGLHKKQFDFLIRKLTIEEIFKQTWEGVLECWKLGWFVT